jgi:hypothetical protein
VAFRGSLTAGVILDEGARDPRLTRSLAIAMLRQMRSLALVSMLVLAGCTNQDAAGSYEGTLTITLPQGSVVTSGIGNLVPSAFELNSTGNGPAVFCDIQQKSQHGTTISFNCATAPCFCSMQPNDLMITAATGTAANDLLSLQFSGTVGQGDAFSAVFMGTFQPGTR